ncbi:MAG: DUF4417 domain-containing protein [Aeromonadales bacterium]|nr:DUF4417 domain-containing protein [Aeromonadales bacterium]MDY2890203.1 DUF4417 domain-containing protein [Succinivibrio sp.]
MIAYGRKIRTAESFLRNGFITNNEYGFATIRTQKVDLEKAKLKPFSSIRSTDRPVQKNTGVHFFIDDYRFNRVYRNYKKYIEILKNYKFVLSPDFSLYADMPIWKQIENVGKNRWCGAYWQSQNICVIPTISWSLKQSLKFCFKGVEEHSIVAVSVVGNKKSKRTFMYGYDCMLESLSPSMIVCYGTPFHEMRGDIVTFDYIWEKWRV